jgi:hypothetical protein
LGFQTSQKLPEQLLQVPQEHTIEELNVGEMSTPHGIFWRNRMLGQTIREQILEEQCKANKHIDEQQRQQQPTKK